MVKFEYSIEVMQNVLELTIESYLDELRPALQSDGGDVEYVGFDTAKGELQLRFMGACSHCGISDITLTHFIRERIMGKFPEVKDIITVP